MSNFITTVLAVLLMIYLIVFYAVLAFTVVYLVFGGVFSDLDFFTRFDVVFENVGMIINGYYDLILVPIIDWAMALSAAAEGHHVLTEMLVGLVFLVTVIGSFALSLIILLGIPVIVVPIMLSGASPEDIRSGADSFNEFFDSANMEHSNPVIARQAQHRDLARTFAQRK